MSSMRWTQLALGATVILLLLADFLAFHDLFEPHTGTEWLILAATVFAAASFVGAAADWRRAGIRHG